MISHPGLDISMFLTCSESYNNKFSGYFKQNSLLDFDYFSFFFNEKNIKFSGYLIFLRIFGFAPRILGPLCLASLGLEGIRSSSFTFDSLAAHNIWFCPQDSWSKFSVFFYRFSWGQNQRLCAARESNVNKLDSIPPGRVKRGKVALESSKMLCFGRGKLRWTAVYQYP